MSQIHSNQSIKKKKKKIGIKKFKNPFIDYL